jgi:hypothetical protein
MEKSVFVSTLVAILFLPRVGRIEGFFLVWARCQKDSQTGTTPRLLTHLTNYRSLKIGLLIAELRTLKKNPICSIRTCSIMGQFHEIFYLCFFHKRMGPLLHRLKRFLTYIRIRGFDYKNRQFKILFCCHVVGKIPFGSFFLYCCFNSCYKSRNIVILTLRCAKKLCALMHSAEFL